MHINPITLTNYCRKMKMFWKPIMLEEGSGCHLYQNISLARQKKSQYFSTETSCCPLRWTSWIKKNRITKKISSLIYDIGGVSNKTTFSHISPKMPACVDKNQQSGGVCYNGECVHQYFTAFFMYFRGKKRHFKIKCNRSPLFFFMSP